MRKKIIILVLVLFIGLNLFGCSLENITDNSSTNNKVSFSSIYYNCNCQSPWATLGIDNSYISLDSNPYDFDRSDYPYLATMYLSDVEAAIKGINSELGIPQSVYQQMLNTTALNGRQTKIYESLGVELSWTYHPDNGLEVTYSKYVK